MEKKRSIGVTFWAWVFIILNVLALFGAAISLIFQTKPQIYGIGIQLIGVILAVAYIICGNFLLKLNEKARKAAIILGIICIFLLPIQLMQMIKGMTNEDIYLEQKQYIIEHTKAESQQESLKNLEMSSKFAKDSAPIIIIVFIGIPTLILELIPIIFFTRPKVKEQFKESINTV